MLLTTKIKHAISFYNIPDGFTVKTRIEGIRVKITVYYNYKFISSMSLNSARYWNPDNDEELNEKVYKFLVDTFGEKYAFVAPSYDSRNMPKITKVIFNDPATIVFWLDGTKTVVKCDDKEIYDPEKGLAMAISKKALGNQGNYYNEFKKWLPDKMHLHIAPTYIRLTPDAVAHDITLEDLTSRNQNAIKALEKSLTERIRNGELKTSDLYNQTIVKDLLFGRYPYRKKGDDQNDL